LHTSIPKNPQPCAKAERCVWSTLWKVEKNKLGSIRKIYYCPRINCTKGEEND